MKRILLVVIILLFSMTLIAPVSAGKPGGGGSATVTVTGVSAGDTVVLAVGESRVFEVVISSDVPFNRAQAGFGQFYPGRSVFASGVQGAQGGTNATLYFTVTGKASTADLPGGVAPVAIEVAVRYGGGSVQAFSIPFNIVVN